MTDDIPSVDIKLVMGDPNAKLSGDRIGIPSSIGPHDSADDINDNGERLLSLCSTSGLSIGNTFFKHKRIHKKTWTSPDGNTSNEIDYICINNRWRSSLQDVQAYRGADVGSDHNLVIGKIHLKLKKERWISCETWDLIDERKRTNNARDQTKDSQGWKTRVEKYGENDKEVKKSCRRCQVTCIGLLG